MHGIRTPRHLLAKNETGFQYDKLNLRILSMTRDLDGTQFRYDTVDAQLDTVFTSNWTTTIIGCMC